MLRPLQTATICRSNNNVAASNWRQPRFLLYMGWLFLIFFLYYLCLLVERSLVNITAHDLDVLRAQSHLSARKTVALSASIRSSLTAQLLARLLLIASAGVWSFVLLCQFESFRQWTGQFHPYETFLWWFVGLFLAVGLSLIFWGLQQVDFHKNKSGVGAKWLPKLWWYAYLWQFLFYFLLQKSKSTASATEIDKQTADAPQSPREASEKRELELLKSIVQFSDVTVKQVMQPRSKVVSVESRTLFPELLEIVRISEFSRMPVYVEDLDNVTGILYVKDLVSHLDKTADFEWQSLIRTNVLLVPEAKRISELLQEFKQQRRHMAVVVDEYGGISGILTMEDILEEVTGDIQDEFDSESEIRFRKLDDFNYLFEGQTLLNDVCRIVGLDSGTFDDIRGTADTLAGLALELRGDIPLIGTEMAWSGYVLTVTHANKRRIEQLKLSLPRTPKVPI